MLMPLAQVPAVATVVATVAATVAATVVHGLVVAGGRGRRAVVVDGRRARLRRRRARVLHRRARVLRPGIARPGVVVVMVLRAARVIVVVEVPAATYDAKGFPFRQQFAELCVQLLQAKLRHFNPLRSFTFRWRKHSAYRALRAADIRPAAHICDRRVNVIRRSVLGRDGRARQQIPLTHGTTAIQMGSVANFREYGRMLSRDRAHDNRMPLTAASSSPPMRLRVEDPFQTPELVYETIR
jgi:hypothetical protein